MDSRLSVQELNRALFRTVSALTSALDLRDHYTVEHQAGVSALARFIGQEMGLYADQIDGLRLGATLHDVGKIGIPTEILTKPTPLSSEEYALVQRHCVLGAQILGEVDSSWPIIEMVLQHHERLDGSGYPQGLVGDDILLEAQIIAVADTTEAMLVDRVYRKAVAPERVIETLLAGRGITLNQDAVNIVVDLLRSEGRNLAAHDISFNDLPLLRTAIGLK